LSYNKRYRNDDCNQTLVYGGLTLLITAVYVFLVGGISILATDQSGQIIGLVLGTAIVVAAIRLLYTARCKRRPTALSRCRNRRPLESE
jgi:hypothetical protein